MNRELLKEAAKELEIMMGKLDEAIGENDFEEAKSVWCDIDSLKTRITAALSEPEPDAMDLAREICEMGDTEGAPIDDETIFEAAALISDYGKRVPRAMLDELFMAAYSFGLGNETRSKWTCIDQIAAKHGVKVEG